MKFSQKENFEILSNAPLNRLIVLIEKSNGNVADMWLFPSNVSHLLFVFNLKR